MLNEPVPFRKPLLGISKMFTFPWSNLSHMANFIRRKDQKVYFFIAYIVTPKLP